MQSSFRIRTARYLSIFPTGANAFQSLFPTTPAGSDGNSSIAALDTAGRDSVSNHGKDIPKDRIAHIFNKFYQADESHSSEGNGIGLAVVKKVCELHGGAVSAKSESGTTTFTVVLPKQQNM